MKYLLATIMLFSLGCATFNAEKERAIQKLEKAKEILKKKLKEADKELSKEV